MTILRFPGYRFGPEGQEGVFDCAEDVPEGWTDNPNDFNAPAEPEPEPEPEPEDGATDEKAQRAAIRATLAGMGIKPANSATLAQLQAKLAEVQTDEG